MNSLPFSLAVVLLVITPCARAQGYFAEHRILDTLPPFQVGFATGDVDWDGLEDLLVPGPTGTLWSFLSQGDGSWFSPIGSSVPANQDHVHLADFDNDGHDDALLAPITNGSSLALAIGQGSGTFGPAAWFFVGPLVREALPVDWNGDGNLDVVGLASQSVFGENPIWCTGDGAGALGPATLLAPASPIALDAVTVGDVDGDLDPDVVGVNATIGVIGLNDGMGNVVPGPFFAPPLGGASRQVSVLELEDMDGDGDRDLVALDFSTWFLTSDFQVHVYLNDGAGGFTLQSSVTVGGLNADVRGLSVLDADGDGDRDVLLSSRIFGSTVFSLANDGTGNLANPVIVADPASGGFVVSDLAFLDGDQDGDRDLLALAHLFLSSTQTELMTWSNLTTRMEATSTPAVGGTVTIQLTAEVHGSSPYLAALSLGSGGLFTPDGRRIPLSLDPLLTWSLGAQPAFGPNPGNLDPQGVATLSLVIPPDPSLIGMSVFGSFVVVDGAIPSSVASIAGPPLVMVLQ